MPHPRHRGVDPQLREALSVRARSDHAGVATKAAKFKAWTPYTPPPIPAGSYDPALDAQLGQAQRGLGDTLQDIATSSSRATTDYGLSLDALNRQQGRSGSDLTQQRDDALGTLGTNLQRGQEDYGRNTQMLAQSYQRLQGQQNQAANAAGVLTGGAVLQAAAKRKANQAQDQQGLDTSWQRAQADNAQSVGLVNRDYATQSGRLTEDGDLARGQLALQSAPPGFGGPLGGRTFQDLNTQATRAQREGGIYGLDVESQKAFQASQSGYVPPARGEAGGSPSNEFVTGDGTHYRVIVKNGRRYRVDPNGRIIGS